MKPITWTRHGDGYEVSTKGDKRFSALVATMPDGRTIESHYQGDIKGYDPGGTQWRLGKGRPPLNPNINLFEEYLKLWREWSNFHPELMDELYELATQHGYCLKDRFATTRVNQAHALSVILNERRENGNQGE